MPLVTATQLAGLRSVAYNGLATTCTAIIRSVQVESDFGSEDAWATVDMDLPCWVRSQSSTNVSSMASRLAVTGTFRIHFEDGVDLEPGDRVVIEGDTYECTETNAENTLRIFATAVARKVA